jgi:CTP synthase (UTP-ammonia lyase)
MDAALLAIRHARENGVPFLGTCGGFQHAVIEYARNVLGWADADHAETAPGATRAVIAPLACSLVEMTRPIRIFPGTLLAAAYGVLEITESYHCRFGLNPQFAATLLTGPLRASAADHNGEVRAVELTNHPFFIATLFQSERAALKGHPVPLATALLSACTERE